MIAVIFEVVIKEGKHNDYLELATDLKVQLEQAEGFMGIERFQSLSDSGKLLSLSFWRDEHCARSWQQNCDHKKAQNEGRSHIFQDYRIRVAHIVRDRAMHDKTETCS